MGCSGEELKERGRGDLQSKKHKKTEEEEGQESQQAARDCRVWEAIKTPGACVRVAAQEMHCPRRGPGLCRDEVMANPFPSSPHLMVSLRTEGGERRAISEGGGKIVWANAFLTLFRLVPPFAS